MAQPTSARNRLLVSIIVGVVTAGVVAVLGGGKFVPLAGWDATALTYIIWLGLVTWPMDAVATKSHAKAEDNGRPVADALLIFASIVSLVAVGFIITQASSSEGLEKGALVGLGLLSVIVSWAVVHASFALKYASLYYGDPEGGIEFNQPNPPRYSDFIYMALTIGMTFQVADTTPKTNTLRVTILKQALLSYLFGAVILGTVINTIANLGN